MKNLILLFVILLSVACVPVPETITPTVTLTEITATETETGAPTVTNTSTKTATVTATQTISPTTPPTVTRTLTATKTPTVAASKTPTRTPTPIKTPIVTTPLPPDDGIGPLELVYKRGGIWLTPDEIQQIPMDNDSWDIMVDWAKKPMDIVKDITWTAGGAGSGDSQTPRAILARVIVGMRTNNNQMLQEAKTEIDRVPEAITKALTNEDEKWPQRNIGPIAVAANLLDYRPQVLLDALHYVIYVEKFDGERITIRDTGLNGLTNKASWGRWSLLTVAYIIEDFNTVNLVVKAHSKAMGERNWAGKVNDFKFNLSGTGAGDDWQTLQPGGKSDPIAIMPAGIYYLDHGVGGLWLADQYRSGNGPVWPPVYTNYIYEGMSSYVAVSWAAHHLGYEDVFALGDYALLRSLVFQYSNFDGKASWPVEGNDTWIAPGIMAWAKPIFGDQLPDYIKPESNAGISWPISVPPSGPPGRGMGFMYTTHYARLVPSLMLLIDY